MKTRALFALIALCLLLVPVAIAVLIAFFTRSSSIGFLTKSRIEDMEHYVIGNTVFTFEPETKLKESAAWDSAVLRTIPMGETLTIIDEPVMDGRTPSLLPVEYQGTKGWVAVYDTFTRTRTATAIEDAAFYIYANDDITYDYIVKKGETVYIVTLTIVDRKSRNRRIRYLVEHDGTFGYMRTDNLRLNK